MTCGRNLLVQVELHDDAVAVAVGVWRVEHAEGLAFGGAVVRVAVEAVRALLAACAGRQEGHTGDNDRSSDRGHDENGGDDDIVEIDSAMFIADNLIR